ncbi:16S rRNA (adenine(1518)-N(6)/adenine(1519)-N(6)) -dimethyltransferase RsmA [Klugiella xanthotipulae]|uniref:Ribosomal RNA small subunit methyltransferase A n=1 Tax=Klugiella xanthotipulae TaxID=244735 RepID=A0A543HXT1_9MICO|nr:16S rRNA (adenine(1518)-N(6)/adenine(1519)-N(6))-dimethyltransferase RsmA [Klugiella xanthotipulae]TQM63168.1 dimethyladenosine transferase [Klugiella xanthotipulae]
MTGHVGDNNALGDHAESSSVRLLGPAEIRDLAGLLNIVPTKKLGQNFVIDPNTVRRIVRVAGVQPGETVVEVGPGLGSLTLGLLEAGADVVAVEIDGRLAAQLPETAHLLAPDARLTVIHADALRVTELPDSPARLVANLPYNVSVPVLLHFMEHFPTLRAGVVMVQAEVGYRLAAGPGSKVYGAPSVKAEWYGTWRTSGQVSRQIFWPVPNVDSVLVGFDRREVALGTEEERLATFALVDAGFQQRRKMLRQSLQPVLGDTVAATAIIAAAGVDPQTRSEQLTVHDFLTIARVFTGVGIPRSELP